MHICDFLQTQSRTYVVLSYRHVKIWKKWFFLILFLAFVRDLTNCLWFSDMNESWNCFVVSYFYCSSCYFWKSYVNIGFVLFEAFDVWSWVPDPLYKVSGFFLLLEQLVVFNLFITQSCWFFILHSWSWIDFFFALVVWERCFHFLGKWEILFL